MTRKIKWGVAVVFSAIVITGAVELLAAPPAFAGSTCWQVDCNTCCRSHGGGVICTQRACV